MTLSEQFLDFGDIPILMHLDRMIFMNNTSDKTFIFEAELPSDVFRIEPRKGAIDAHSQQRLHLSIYAPETPSIVQVTIPIIFREPACESAQSEATAVEETTEDEILAIDPPIDNQLKKMSALKKLREREDNWKSVGERTLEASSTKKPTNDGLFSTHIGKRGAGSGRESAQAPSYRQVIDIVCNVIAKEEYRDLYGSINPYAFEAENTLKPEGELQQKEEIADILGAVVDRVISDDQEKRLAMKDAQLRRQHIPFFSQLYKKVPVVELEHEEVPDARYVDDIGNFLHSIIDETIVEADDRKFDLTKEIIHVSGFRPLD
jgi:hypothetical protein